MIPALARLARAPLVHFLVLGAMLLSVVDRLQPPTLVVRASDLERVRAEWIRETGRNPTPAELQASRAHAIDEELMVREALRLRLDRTDPVVRERLVRNLEFLSAASTSAAEIDRRIEDARRLDMPARDPVTRRRLVQLMEARLANGPELGEADLSAFMDRHAGRYAQPERRAFRQVFFSRDVRRGREAADAEAALARLSNGESVTGDPFLAGETFPPLDARTIASRWGETFARAVSGAAPGRWVGPVPSAWGEHLVFVEQVLPAAAPVLDAVRTRVAYAALDEREQDNVRAGLASLRGRWRVEIEGS